MINTLKCISEDHIDEAMAWCHWVNIGSGNGLLPDGTKPLPEPVLTYHIKQQAIVWFHLDPELYCPVGLLDHSDYGLGHTDLKKKNVLKRIFFNI